MRVDEFALGRVLGEVAQERARLRHGPAENAARMRRQKQRFAAGDRVAAHQTLRHRRPFHPLLRGEVGEAQHTARKDLAVLADEFGDDFPRLGVERVIGRAHVGEFGVAALCRQDVGMQQRIFGGGRFERTVGVPQHVAEAEQPAAVVAGQNLVVTAKVRDVGDLDAEAAFRLPADIAVGEIERPELAGEGQLLRVVDLLVGEDQHGEAIHSLGDGGDRLRARRLTQIDPIDLAEEIGPGRIGRVNREGHALSLLGGCPGAAADDSGSALPCHRRGQAAT